MIKLPYQPEPIQLLIGRLFLALPPLYALWFFGAEFLFAPVAPLLHAILSVLMSDSLDALRITGHMLEFDTLLPVQLPDGRRGEASISVDILSYTFSLPTLIAMLWAAKALTRPLKTLFLAYVLLLPTWLWSLGFWFAKSAIFNISAQAAEKIGVQGIGLELIGLGYQFGTLILPSVAVVLIFALLCPHQMQSLFGVEPSIRDRRAKQTKKNSKRP